MGKGLLAAIKLALILAIVALAVVGSLYVLEVFATEEARLALKKILSMQLSVRKRVGHHSSF
jgi:hypothetical protein